MMGVIQGDAREALGELPAESVHLCITSPPYWGLRRYEAPDVTFSDRWRGQLGAEPTIELYVSHLVEVFREVKRVLRPDGLCFLNLGDSMASTGSGGHGATGGLDKSTLSSPAALGACPTRRPKPHNLKPKDLCEIPSEVVKALRADGWWLRSRIPWLKRNSLPESCEDRPASAIEYWFMLAKSARCYWDPEAVRIRFADERMGNPGTNNLRRYGGDNRQDVGRPTAWTRGAELGGRNRRNSDWLLESFQGLILDDMGGPLCMLVNPQGYDAEFCRAPDCQRYYDGPDKKLVRIEKYKDERGEKKQRRWCLCGRSDAWLSHYATFPEKMIEPIILAATSEKGCCPKCGAGWERIVKRKSIALRPKSESIRGKCSSSCAYPGQPQRGSMAVNVLSLGWRPGCACNAGEPVPCVVCDPFSGTGTTMVVAERLGRRGIAVEVSPDYIAMSKLRLAAARREPVPECDPALPLFREGA